MQESLDQVATRTPLSSRLPRGANRAGHSARSSSGARKASDLVTVPPQRFLGSLGPGPHPSSTAANWLRGFPLHRNCDNLAHKASDMPHHPPAVFATGKTHPPPWLIFPVEALLHLRCMQPRHLARTLKPQKQHASQLPPGLGGWDKRFLM